MQQSKAAAAKAMWFGRGSGGRRRLHAGTVVRKEPRGCPAFEMVSLGNELMDFCVDQIPSCVVLEDMVSSLQLKDNFTIRTNQFCNSSRLSTNLVSVSMHICMAPNVKLALILLVPLLLPLSTSVAAATRRSTTRKGLDGYEEAANAMGGGWWGMKAASSRKEVDGDEEEAVNAEGGGMWLGL